MPEPTFPADTPTVADLCDDELDTPLAALLARGAQDTGVATETVRLDTLTESEKRVLLALLQSRMGMLPPIAAPDATAFPPKKEDAR